MTKRDEVLTKLSAKIVRFAMSKKLNVQDAEDVGQDTLLLIHERYSHLERESDLVPLGIHMAKLKCHEKLRGLYRAGVWPENYDPVSDDLLPDELLERTQWLEWISAVIPKLEERCRRIFELQLRGFETRAIAETLGLTVNALHVAALRCRRQALELAPMGARP